MTIRNKIRENIVIVKCGTTFGTAFFISRDRLLTAYHNIGEWLVDPETDLGIIVGGDFHECSAKPLAGVGERIDAALLVLSDPDQLKSVGVGLKLLCQDPNPDMELTMHGFPKEIGDCRAPFLLSLKHIDTIEDSDADYILVKTSDVSFFSYEGYSGAPLLNKNGSVIGIISVQENQNLRAISVNKLRVYLESHGIGYSSEGLAEDDSPTGLVKCSEILNQNLRLSPGKFNARLHQKNSELDTEIRKWMDVSSMDRLEGSLTKIKDWASRYNNHFVNYNIQIDSSSKKPEVDFIYDVCYMNYNIFQTLPPDLKKIQEKTRPLLNEYNQNKSDFVRYSKRIFGIFGPAGVGKSHMTYFYSDKLLKEGNYVYYINGANITATLDPESQIKQLIGLTDENLRKIDEIAFCKHKNVLFVIDAINEGAGYHYWKLRLEGLVNSISEYKTFKILITGRRSDSGISDILEGISLRKTYHPFILEGFENKGKAIEEYCEYYEIEERPILSLGVDFSNPLFLSIFCKAYRSLGAVEPEKLSRINVYSVYLGERNHKISSLIDEDPHRNVTVKAIKSLAEYSVFHNSCEAVKREDARRICNRIVFRREWSKNLLNQLINENLLYEIREWLPFEEQTVDFEFQNFGDVFRASAILERKNNIRPIILDLIRKSEDIIRFGENVSHCLEAVFGMWNFKEDPTEYLQMLSLDALDEILWYNNSRINDLIGERFIRESEKLSIDIFFRHSLKLSEKCVLAYHNYLKSIPMSVRDHRYIEGINRNYNIYGRSIYSEYNLKSDKSISLRRLLYWSWQCATSFPDYRAILIREMAETLFHHTDLCVGLVTAFYDVDDASVLQSVLCAIYGAMLMSSNREMSIEIARFIRDKFSDHEIPMSRNLLVRQWIDLIIEFANHISPAETIPELEYSDRNSINPLDWDLSEIKPEILGDTPGGKRLQYNIFRTERFGMDSDFNRYIIGTNSSKVNRYFITPEGRQIDLDDISKMIAKEVINLGWNDSLGAIDIMDPPFERYDNLKEKIGKKYLWIAYQNVMALLSDNCLFSEDYLYSNSSRKINFISDVRPWMIEGRSLFDPTLTISKSINQFVPELTFKNEIKDLRALYDSGNFATPIFSATDDESIEWLQLDAWDNWRENRGDYRGVSFHLQYVSWVVKDIDEYDIKGFLKDHADYNPDMPYDSLYYCLWNEIPWSRRSGAYKYTWKEFDGSNGIIMPLRICHLQEEMGGIDYENQPISNAMSPNWEFLETMKLYTAERGIVRMVSDHSVASYNRTITEQGCDGLILRKDLLDDYLNKINGTLIMRIEYYKCDALISAREFEWFVYDENNGFESISRIKA